MKFLKEKKGIIISFIIGVIIASSITVYAYNYIASDVIYTKKDGTEISVENALNDLYSKSITTENSENVKIFFKNYPFKIQNTTSKEYKTGTFTGTNENFKLSSEKLSENEKKSSYISVYATNYYTYVSGNDAYIYIKYNNNDYYILSNNSGYSDGNYTTVDIPVVDNADTYEVWCGARNYHTNSYINFTLNKTFYKKYRENVDNIDEYINLVNSVYNYE